MKKLNILLLIGLFIIGCESNTKQNHLPYVIVEQEDISYLDNPRITSRVILDVDTIPSEIEIINTATYIYEQENKKWKGYTVFIYLPEMNTGFASYGIGEFNKDGLVNFRINKNSLKGTTWEIKEEIIQKTIQELTEYSIDISTTNIEKRKVKITINTNFPDGTKLLVSIGRTHFIKGRKDAYSADIFNEDLVVESGKIKTIVEINDFKWYNEYKDLSESLPKDFPPAEKISDKINIDVLFSPYRKQSDGVLDILGGKGEYIRGIGSEKSGKATFFRVSKKIKIPFKK